ncbi:MAG: RDD family protein, partial [Anaerolineales bacterium]|nr:RDD family protein [Anaerolineales bacterium]
VSDDFLSIDTPENVVFGYEVVGIGSRFMAALMDTLIIFGLQLVALFGLGLAFRLLGEGDIVQGWAVAAYGLVSFVLLWGYYIYFELRWNGRSPGKKAVGITVIRKDGTPITLAESVIRNLVRLVDFMPFAYGAGVVTMFIDGRSRRLGDMAAGTLVVRVPDEVTLASLAHKASVPTRFRAPGVAETAVNDWPIYHIPETDILLAEEFLRRRIEINNEAPLIRPILNKLLAPMNIPGQTVSDDDALHVLARIVKLYREKETGD